MIVKFHLNNEMWKKTECNAEEITALLSSDYYCNYDHELGRKFEKEFSCFVEDANERYLLVSLTEIEN